MQGQSRQINAPRSTFKRTGWFIVKWALFAVILALVVRALWRGFIAIDWSLIRVHPWPLVAAFVLAIASRCMIMFPYHAILAAFGLRPRWRVIMGAAFVPPLGKYLPGKVASVAAFIWILKRVGVPGSTSAGVVVLANVLSQIIGLLLSIPLTLMEPVRHLLPYAWMWCIILMVLSLVCLHPGIADAGANFLLKRRGYQEIHFRPTLRTYAWPAISMLIQWLCLGLSTWCLGRSISQVELAQLPVFISASALATTAGFLAVFAPGGLGVREGIMLAILAPMLKQEAAIIIVASRLLLTIVEVGMAIVGMGFLKSIPRFDVEKNV